MKRDFYLDVYTILNRIQLTIWTICAFRVLNPRQWSLAKFQSYTILKLDRIYIFGQKLELISEFAKMTIYTHFGHGILISEHRQVIENWSA